MPRYDRRIATRISRDADNRLRLASAVQRRPLSAVLSDAIRSALPTADELAGLLRDDADEAAVAN